MTAKSRLRKLAQKRKKTDEHNKRTLARQHAQDAYREALEDSISRHPAGKARVDGTPVLIRDVVGVQLRSGDELSGGSSEARQGYAPTEEAVRAEGTSDSEPFGQHTSSGTAEEAERAVEESTGPSEEVNTHILYHEKLEDLIPVFSHKTECSCSVGKDHWITTEEGL